MRQVYFTPRPQNGDAKAFADWAASCFEEIDRASQDDMAGIVNDFEVANYTATRSLDAGTATTADIANVLCTLIADLKNRGSKRSQ